MFRKFILGLAAAATLGLGAVAMTPAPAAADVGFGFSIGSPGYRHYAPRPRYDYRSRYHGPRRHYRGGRDCYVRTVRRVRPNGTVVVRQVRDCDRRGRW